MNNLQGNIDFFVCVNITVENIYTLKFIWCLEDVFCTLKEAEIRQFLYSHDS